MKSFLFNGMSDYLRAKALSEFIFKDSENFVGVKEYLCQINSINDTSVEIFSDIATFYTDEKGLEGFFNHNRVAQYFNERSAQGIFLLLASCGKKTFNLNKSEVRNLISDVLLSGQGEFCDLVFSCHFEGFDFSDVKFLRCHFNDVIFRDCLFNRETLFGDCSFGGEFEVLGCSGFDEVSDRDCNFKSMQARSTFENRVSHASTRKVKPDDIKVLVREALRLLNSRPQTHKSPCCSRR